MGKNTEDQRGSRRCGQIVCNLHLPRRRSTRSLELSGGRLVSASRWRGFAGAREWRGVEWATREASRGGLGFYTETMAWVHGATRRTRLEGVGGVVH
jgi:hypothetical protein